MLQERPAADFTNATPPFLDQRSSTICRATKVNRHHRTIVAVSAEPPSSWSDIAACRAVRIPNHSYRRRIFDEISVGGSGMFNSVDDWG
jgi:hypothetical protein